MEIRQNKKLGVILAILSLILPNITHAAELSGGFVTNKQVSTASFFDFLGFSQRFVKLISPEFSPGSMLSSIFQINYLLSFAVLLSVIFLGYYLIRIISYSNPDGKNATHLGLVFAVMQHKALDFFQKYCVRKEDGTYICSFTKHKHYFKLARISFLSAAISGSLKVVLIFTLFILQNNISNAGGRTSTNYNIFADSTLGGGGQIASTNYSLQASLSEPIATPVESFSTNYRSDTGILALTDEPSIGIIIEDVSIDFGALTSNSVSYGTHTISTYFNGVEGYDIVITGEPPMNGSGDQLTPIGTTASTSIPGTEQYGINLKANTSPNIGSNPSGGHGVAFGQYATSNSFAYGVGDTVARATQQSTTTIYTVTVIANISDSTPSGSYSASLIYSMVPRY